ncbi:hypothetical protein [Candidatus Enterovibrio altilux]
MQCYLTCSNRLVEKSMKYLAMALTTLDNIAKLFTLKMCFHSSHQKRSNSGEQDMVTINVPYQR